jgi:hypothetical protein
VVEPVISKGRGGDGLEPKPGVEIILKVLAKVIIRAAGRDREGKEEGKERTLPS